MLAALAGVVALLLAGAVAWLSSESALVTLVQWAVERGEGRLAIERPRGTLLGEMQIGSIVYRDEGTTVTLEDVTLDHRPRTLLDRRLTLDTFAAKRVRVELAASDEPASLPESLALPIDVTIDRATIETLEWKTGDSEGSLADLRFAYSADRAAHVLRDLDVRGPGGRLTGSARVATTKPYAAQAALVLDLVKPHPEGRVEARIEGDLDVLSITGKSTLAGVAADARAKVAPFAKQPLLEGSVDAKDVDLKRLDARLPTTRLAVVVDAKPAPGGFAGQVHVVNSLPGPIDAERIPVSAIKGAFALSGVMLQLSEIAAQAGGGAVSGSGSVNIDTFENRWKLAIDRLDLKQVHGALIETRLAGSVQADVKDDVQRVVANVSQKDIQLDLDARYDGKTVFADRVRAVAYGGSVEGSGRIDPSGDQPFMANLRAQSFDPSRFGNFPAGMLNGVISAKGSAARPDIEADVAIAPGSRLAGLATQGQIAGQFKPGSVQRLAADMTLGSNRIQANGAVGRAGDRLNLVIAAKRLAEIAPLLPASTPKPIAGSMSGTATIETLARGARFDADLRGTDLRAGPDIQVASLSIVGRATHAAPLDAPRIDALQDVSLALDAARASTPSGFVDSARVSVDGNAATHSIVLAARQEPYAVDAAITASLTGSGSALAWRGRVERASAQGLPGITQLALTTPAKFDVGRQRVTVDAFGVTGGGAVLEVDRFAWTPQSLDTRGRFRNLPVAPFVKLAGQAERFPTDVTLGGEWDVTARPDWRGSITIARERGDVYIDDPSLQSTSKLSLGIEALALKATFDGQRVDGTAEFRSRLGGNASAKFDLRAPAGTSNPFAPASQIRANVRANLQSLASLQPWIGTSARLQGQAVADVDVGGTLERPTLDGKVTGQALRLDIPRYGVNLKDGQLRIASGPEGLRLEELSFVAGEGKFFASGLLGLPVAGGGSAGTSRIQWRAENFRALNRPDLRLIVDGEGTLAMEQKRLVLKGTLSADEGNIEYRSTADTTLADDIVVVGRPRPGGARSDGLVADAPLDLDLELVLGRNLRFAGEGLEARLAGRVNVTSRGGGPMMGKGTIRTVRGTYYAFGQKLAIERGRILFDGPLANPSLDIVALRKNLAVEAGVEIVGTVRAPVVRLTSNPPVPDNEKLAWLLTGGPAGSGSARDSAALSAAAAALSGNQGKPLTQRIAQRIGLDDISVAQRDTASGSDPLDAQVVTIGKRISDRLYIAYEQGLSLATNALRIEYVLSRYLTVSAFAGTESGVALNFRRNWQ